MSPDPFDWDAPDAPIQILQLVQNEIRPFLVDHRKEAIRALARWLTERVERVSSWDRQRQEWLDKHALDTSRDWLGTEPPVPGYVLIRGKVGDEIRDCWGPAELNQRVQLNEPIPLPTNRDLTADECWVALLAVHDECRADAERIVNEHEGGLPFAAMADRCWRRLSNGDRVWNIEEEAIRCVLVQAFQRQNLTAIRNAAEQPPPAAAPITNQDTSTPPPLPQYVTLDQIAATVRRGKKTLERRLNEQDSDMPRPDIEGGGGKPHEWLWPRIRPWLEKEFSRPLPALFPSFRTDGL